MSVCNSAIPGCRDAWTTLDGDGGIEWKTDAIQKISILYCTYCVLRCSM